MTRFRILFFIVALLCAMSLQAQRCEHIVQRGENFSSIAQKYGITVEELKASNPASSSCYMTKVNASAFKKLDIRNVKTFKIPAKSCEVLTQMPANSYKVSDNGDGTSTLTITDATRFWSVTNYLVIKY